MERCTQSIGSAQNPLSSFCALDLPGRVSTHFGCFGKARTQAFASDDRGHPLKSAPYCREFKAKRGERCSGRTAGGLNARLHAVCDGNGRPIRIALTEGQRSDYDGARLLLADLPETQQVLADKGYDADRFRDALAKRNISACIPVTCWI